MNTKCLYILAAFVATILLSMLVPRPRVVTNSIESFRSSRPAEPEYIRPVAANTFLLVKTGVEVAYTRLPPHINTTLRRFPHHAVYADAKATIDGVEVVDCLSFLPESTLNGPGMTAYRVRQQMKEEVWNWGNNEIFINGGTTGWELDKFKNVPAYAEAWTRSQDFDWYVMIDADSYLLTYTLEEVTKGYNPDDILYFGKGVGGGDNTFAHGGSGIVLSRGAMRAMYGDSDESIKNTLELMAPIAESDCCGDSVVMKVYKSKTEKAPLDTLQLNEHGQFQGCRIISAVLDFTDQWCKAVGVFHGVHPWEVFAIDEWEQKFEAENKNPRYYDFYRDFMLPYIRPEIDNWISPDPPGVNSRKWEAHDIESQEKDSCKQACENDEDCTQWSFRRGTFCMIFRNLVMTGEAKNKYNSDWKDGDQYVTGYMVDRIRDRRRNQECDGLRIEESDPKKKEGWYFDQMKESGRDLSKSIHVDNVVLHMNASI